MSGTFAVDLCDVDALRPNGLALLEDAWGPNEDLDDSFSLSNLSNTTPEARAARLLGAVVGATVEVDVNAGVGVTADAIDAGSGEIPWRPPRLATVQLLLVLLLRLLSLPLEASPSQEVESSPLARALLPR